MERAAASGFRFIELRQGCLGECEDRRTLIPNPDAVAALTASFPSVTLNLAVQLPVLSECEIGESHGIQTILEAARSTGRHLRIVDLETLHPATTDSFFELRSKQFSEWLECLGPDSTLSIEHAYQPWSEFWPAMARLR